MFWPIKARNSQRRLRDKQRRRQELRINTSRRSRFEPLESRRVLAGTVNIEIGPVFTVPGAVAGDVALLGDPQPNNVVVTAAPGGFLTITRPANDFTTMFTINGLNPLPSQTLAFAITGDLLVGLGGASDTFVVRDATLPSDLVIANTSGDDVYTVDGTVVSAGVWHAALGAGKDQLTIQKSAAGNRSAVVGGTFFADTGGGGSEVKVIDSDLRGIFPVVPATLPPTVPAVTVAALSALLPNVGFGLHVSNVGGADSVKVLGDSTVGAGANPPNTGQEAISIVNGPGGSNVVFGPNPDDAAGGSKRVSVFGGIRIANGGNAPGQLDIASFTQTDVTGGVGIDHLAGPGGAGGNTMTIVSNSNLGTDITPPGVGGTPAGGYPLEILAEDGQDSISIGNNSSIPWGVFINNAAAAGGIGPGPALAGTGANVNTVSINTSAIGNRPGGPGSPVRFAGRFPVSGGPGTPGLAAGDALFISGDNGADIVTVNTLVSVGNVNINVFNGENQVTVMGATPITPLASLSIIGGTGTDIVTLDDLSSPANVYLELGFGSDTLKLVGNVTFAANPVVGTLVIFTGTPLVPGAGANDVLDISMITTLIPNPLFGIDTGFDNTIT